jgi:hypothetical protein
MTRYWVALGPKENPCDEESEDYVTEEEFLQELKKLSNCESDTGYQYVTEERDEAVRVAQQAVAINEKYGRNNNVNIVTQPQCPKCGTSCPFNASYCRDCGSEVTDSEDIPFEGRC